MTYHLWCRLESNPGSSDYAELAQAAESAIEEVGVLLGRAGDNISSSCIHDKESATVVNYRFDAS
jgi:hypothetical protein